MAARFAHLATLLVSAAVLVLLAAPRYADAGTLTVDDGYVAFTGKAKTAMECFHLGTDIRGGCLKSFPLRNEDDPTVQTYGACVNAVVKTVTNCRQALSKPNVPKAGVVVEFSFPPPKENVTAVLERHCAGDATCAAVPELYCAFCLPNTVHTGHASAY
ncbi:hypothetical protein HDU96_000758 [Phlyctochytrium bullatum]|nr:hypothetical protein HDU96_000758 [Phlyctochytrium bullatum]